MWPSGSLVQLSDKTKIKNKINKLIAEQEPRSAHGRAVKNIYIVVNKEQTIHKILSTLTF